MDQQTVAVLTPVVGATIGLIGALLGAGASSWTLLKISQRQHEVAFRKDLWILRRQAYDELFRSIIDIEEISKQIEASFDHYGSDWVDSVKGHIIWDNLRSSLKKLHSASKNTALIIPEDLVEDFTSFQSDLDNIRFDHSDNRIDTVELIEKIVGLLKALREKVVRRARSELNLLYGDSEAAPLHSRP